jgi:citrate synthase/citryl-CoA lyase
MIGSIHDGEYHLHDIPISTLMREHDLVSVLTFAWLGSFPSAVERRVLEACLIACVDHGEEPPSAHVARRVASCGKPLADCVAAGLLTLGPRHGNAGSTAALWIKAGLAAQVEPTVFAKQALSSGQRLSGVGHPEYTVDPRTNALWSLVQELQLPSEHFAFAQAVSVAMTVEKGKPLPLNIDGALGAIVNDLRWSPEIADAIFLVARTIGLAHQDRGFRRPLSV